MKHFFCIYISLKKYFNYLNFNLCKWQKTKYTKTEEFTSAERIIFHRTENNCPAAGKLTRTSVKYS